MLQVKFYESIDDGKLDFAVIVSRYKNSWVFCKHKSRDTYEIPGGHREPGEDILTAAKRELWEETGAEKYNIRPVCVYSVIKNGVESYGMLYFAEIESFGKLPDLEIEKIELFKDLPGSWTYPLIQPLLLEKVKSIVL